MSTQPDILRKIRMTHHITLAAIQLDGTPAPLADRLARAERLIEEAAQQGAEVVLLPELFNTGYSYSEMNHYLAETLSDPTPTWMQETAARLNIHLAGSLFLRDEGEIYNSLLLFAPDGRQWRYDKNQPWAWERAYFRPGNGPTIAETDLGRIGLLICWDVAHLSLWQAYAGQVDLMLLSSCPPNLGHSELHFPSGDSFSLTDLGPLFRQQGNVAEKIFGQMVAEQVAWLGVPAVHAAVSGQFRSRLPAARSVLLSLLPQAPRLSHYVPQAAQVQMRADFTPATHILNAEGTSLAHRTPSDGESIALAQVSLAQSRPQPQLPQPPSPVSPFIYHLSDTLIPGLMKAHYRRGLQQAWGQPPRKQTAKSGANLSGLPFGVAGLVGVVGGFLVARWLLRRLRR
jgi:N-carbamoylputrescine amidase